MTIETVLDAHAAIGESLTWVPEQGALYWIDVKAPALHRFCLRGRSTDSWMLSSDVGAFALTEDGGAIVALRHGVFRLDLESHALQALAPPPFDPQLFRFNEGACDANGRFWIGVMYDPMPGASRQEQTGQLHSFTLREGLRAEPDAAALHNGMAWSGDGRTFFLSHSRTGEIIAFDYEQDRGVISSRRVFATVPAEAGIPDGGAVDSEGGYWSALHGGGRLRRFHPDGTFDRDLELPVSQPTMPAFADDDLAKLYLTSATHQLSPQALQQEPCAGAILRLDTGSRGIARRFSVR